MLCALVTCFVIPEIGVSNSETGPEHAGDAGTLPQPSYCTLPMFHPQSDPSVAPALGYISNDGHHFSCRNPVVMQQAFHVYVSYVFFITFDSMIWQNICRRQVRVGFLCQL